MNIVTRKFSFESKWDGVVIRGICMVPEKPVAILQMVHGMCEHKERFLPFMQNMAERGYITVLHDNRGHGASVEKSEDIGYCYDSMEKGYIEDIYRVTRNIRKAYPNLPLILYGHSMGSLAVRAYLRNHDNAIDALIVSGCPAYNNMVPAGRLLVKTIARLYGMRYRSKHIQNLVLRSFEKRFRKENRKNAWLAAEESVAEKFETDPLCTFTYTMNGILTLLNLESITYKAAGYQVKNPDLPVLFLSGKDDPCYINEQKWNHAVKRMRNLGYHQLTEIRYDGMRHEIHNEKDKDRVFEDIDYFCRSILQPV